MMCSYITCGTERNECLRVFADYCHLVLGKGQPAYDVLYKIIGYDRGHVPLQLPEYNQFPILKDREGGNHEVLVQIQFLGRNLLSQRVNGRAAMSPLTVK